MIDDFKHNEGLHRWQSTVSVSLKLSKFDDFYKTIRNEYVKRNKANDKNEEIQAPAKIDREASEKTVWSNDFKWDGNNFLFGKYGSINIVSNDRKHILKVLADKKVAGLL